MNRSKCSISECGRDAITKKFCNKHYLRFHHYGDPTIVHKRGDSHPLTYDQWQSWFVAHYSQEKFDYLLDSLFNNCKTLRQIGDEFGRSHERIRQWRNEIRGWKPEFVSQKTQRHYCSILDSQRRFILPTAMAYCKERSEVEGLKVQLVRQNQNEIRWAKSLLLINNNLCCIHFIKNMNQVSRGNFYHHGRLCRKNNIQIIVTSNFKLTAYIFPVGILKKECYLPVDPDRISESYNKPKIDWKLYREAWHLLKEEPKEKA